MKDPCCLPWHCWPRRPRRWRSRRHRPRMRSGGRWPCPPNAPAPTASSSIAASTPPPPGPTCAMWTCWMPTASRWRHRIVRARTAHGVAGTTHRGAVVSVARAGAGCRRTRERVGAVRRTRAHRPHRGQRRHAVGGHRTGLPGGPQRHPRQPRSAGDHLGPGRARGSPFSRGRRPRPSNMGRDAVARDTDGTAARRPAAAARPGAPIQAGFRYVRFVPLDAAAALPIREIACVWMPRMRR